MLEKSNKFKTYQEVCDYISNQHSVVYSLDHFKKFMSDIGNPQNNLKVIHIAGTNGKGSTTNYVASILQVANYKVGTFTSPALVNRLDVIRINGVPIKEEVIVEYANQYLDTCIKYHLSQFEIEVYFSVLYFLENHVDFVVYEVGLGGRLDATNIVSPIVTAITNIGLDHTDYLGNTHALIAKEKAGIIKDGIPLFTTSKREDVMYVFEKECIKHNSRLIHVFTDFKYSIDDYKITYDYKNYHIVLNTPALYQIGNSILAINIIEYLNFELDLDISVSNLEQGLFDMHWPARFEIVSTNPLIILDGAHNKEGIDALYESIKEYKNIKILFSALKDKDTVHMLEKLGTLTDDITITEFNHDRFGSIEELNQSFNYHVEKDYKKFIDENMNYKGTLVITGSLYFLSQLRPYLIKKLM